MVIHPGVLASAYASIRWLRHDLNCSLPLEVWFKPDEMARTHPVLVALPYALFYSAFDNVLLVDCDNFAVRNPEFLFDEPAFLATGALFWPPDNSCFGIDGYSMLWNLTGLDFVDMFEQESGQVAVNKRASDKALHVLMFYAFRTPSDLYRLAWLKAGAPFHMIERPPGSLRRRNHQTGGAFGGKSKVQYAPDGTVLFLHRNSDKLTGCVGDSLSWGVLQEFRYLYRPATLLGLLSDRDANCFGHSDNLVDTYTETDVRCPQDNPLNPLDDMFAKPLIGLLRRQRNTTGDPIST
ncbi:hypothetical protein H310_11207 [Aphanomyces invadans]|uniref:Nucleotide-diphospho-sugar transferase domain-containing protein n=1 Tax=Aphanomyces invadans TaxID=157072 RepID=A0A024TMT0_9STRA|nr:hypothetical protein H310_11207 [Aphanomyces invadans]ETV95309.1 hypothetical protein H310_11207 [Aphanomyces invadans]|eukprot:XP_008876010.1 hypothetical protein H310_11207 [Aphanomyces invadans]